jgi:hypothetical protein
MVMGKGTGRERNEKAFLERTTAGWRQPSKDRGQMGYGLDRDDKGKDGEEDFELFAKGEEGKGMERNENAFLVRTTAGLRQASKNRGKTEHGLHGRGMGYGIIARTTAGSREPSKDRGQLARVFLNANHQFYYSPHCTLGSSSRVVNCKYLFAFFNEANKIRKNIYAMSFERSSQH